jgi:DNA-binding NarL/FixJ family response regulator
MKILLADDHGLFVEGLQNLLHAGGYEVAGAAYNGLEALQLARQLHPDVILMDIRMPNCSGLQATRLIKTELPEIKIVMLTTSAESDDLFEALKSGASGYLLKNLKPNELFDYLAGLSRGEAPLSPELSARLLEEFSRQAAVLDARLRAATDPALTGSEQAVSASDLAPTQPTRNGLTARQLQVLEMVAGGLAYKEVGATLHISENTVKYHMGEILERLHSKNREQVVSFALLTGLVQRRDAPD